MKTKIAHLMLSSIIFVIPINLTSITDPLTVEFLTVTADHPDTTNCGISNALVMKNQHARSVPTSTIVPITTTLDLGCNDIGATVEWSLSAEDPCLITGISTGSESEGDLTVLFPLLLTPVAQTVLTAGNDLSNHSITFSLLTPEAAGTSVLSVRAIVTEGVRGIPEVAILEAPIVFLVQDFVIEAGDEIEACRNEPFCYEVTLTNIQQQDAQDFALTGLLDPSWMVNGIEDCALGPYDGPENGIWKNPNDASITFNEASTGIWTIPILPAGESFCLKICATSPVVGNSNLDICLVD